MIKWQLFHKFYPEACTPKNVNILHIIIHHQLVAILKISSYFESATDFSLISFNSKMWTLNATRKSLVAFATRGGTAKLLGSWTKGKCARSWVIQQLVAFFKRDASSHFHQCCELQLMFSTRKLYQHLITVLLLCYGEKSYEVQKLWKI